VNGTEDSYGFVSVLNMYRHAGVKAIQEIRNHMLRKCTDKKMRDVLTALFTDSSKGLGLLLNERMVNMPDAFAPPLHQNLFDEVAIAYNAEKAAAPPGTPLYWDLENYIFLTTIYLETLPSRVCTRSE
jgi:protein BCP1